MSSVSVSKGSLYRVKTALRDFQTSIEASGDHVKSHAEDVITSTRASIKKQIAIVESLRNKVASLSADVEQYQAQIISNNNQANSLRGRIESASSRVSNLETQIAQLNAHRQRLLSQGSSSSNNTNDNSAQVSAIENQIQSCERQRRQLNEQISSMRSQESNLNTQIARLRNDKTRLEAALATGKNELVKAGEKCERMKSAGVAVESSISSFLGVVKQFKQTVVTTSDTGLSGIEKCLAAIEEYEAVNLGRATGSAQSSCEAVNSAQMQQDTTETELEKLRSSAVAAAWKRERDLVLNGRGTRNWTVAQQAELIQYGSIRGFEGQHMLSVSQYPQHAGNPDNIQFLTYEEHFYGAHDSSWRNSSSGRFDPTSGELHRQGDDAIPDLPEITLTDRYDPAQYDLTLSLGRGFGYARREDVDESRIRHQGE